MEVGKPLGRQAKQFSHERGGLHKGGARGEGGI